MLPEQFIFSPEINSSTNKIANRIESAKYFGERSESLNSLNDKKGITINNPTNKIFDLLNKRVKFNFKMNYYIQLLETYLVQGKELKISI